MLAELRVRNLGVIEDVSVVLAAGMTALTGETGAGKTLLVDAIALLLGAPADSSLVRPGSPEALVEGRFLSGTGEEVIVTRVVPASGRSRCYLDGRMVAAAQLAELGRNLVDLHGQHAHQSLLSPAAQRAALDQAAAIDTTDVAALRRRVRELSETRRELGGDARDRARQLDLLAYQLREIEAAGLEDVDEDDRLREEQELLADATGTVEAAAAVWQGLSGDDGVIDRLGALVRAAAGCRPLERLHTRLQTLQEELSDVATESRELAENLEADPARLGAIAERRRLLAELRRKYGGSLADVIAYASQLRDEVDLLASHDERVAAVEAELSSIERDLEVASLRLWTQRREAAPRLGKAVEAELRQLAMPQARFTVAVGEEPGSEDVTWLLGANPGGPLLPLAKVASGGELARTMLAARLVIGPAGDGGSMTLVFDEVDAGIGGEAAVEVGRALAALAPAHQVLVVTHLAQVAAAAGHHLVVGKTVEGGRTVADVRSVDGDKRVVELARMLSGRPDSESARRHAEELLGIAGPSPSAG